MPETVVMTPIDYDAENIPPDAPPGAWQATASAKASKTSKDSYPMIIVDWELETAYEEENESFVGARVSDFLTFFPESRAGASKMSKLRLKTFCDKLGISRTLIPKHIATSDDLQEFIDAIDGQKTDIWTVHEKQVDKDTKEEIVRVKVLYKAPGGAAQTSLPPVDDGLGGTEEEEEEEEEQEEEQEEERERAAAAAPTQAPEARSGTRAALPPAKKAANGAPAKKKAAGRR